MVKRGVIALVTVVGVGLVACAQIIGLSDLQEGGDPFDGGEEGSSSGDGGDGGTDGDASAADLCANGVKDGDETDIDCGGSKCGKCAKGKACKVNADCAKECVGGKCVGCAGVELDGGNGPCIDATEVTVAEYFVVYGAERRSHPPRDLAACTGEVKHPPKGDNPSLPVRSVRWCTAAAYCSFIGKHLCRGDEWLDACSGGGSLAYPYGNSFESTRCNDEGSGGPWDAGSGTNCKTLDPLNVYDLSGNVAEWQNACDAGRDAATSSCVVRGGSYESASDQVRCDSAKVIDVNAELPDVGFRCCE